jgi:hypothetical protein
MNRTCLIIALFCGLMAGCSKDKLEEKDLCTSELCNQYYEVWKKILMSRSNMPEAYFEDHVFPYKSEVQTWYDGESFSVYYQVKIGWMICRVSDSFIIKVTTDGYPAINVPRNVYLNDSIIDQMITDGQFSCRMHVITPVENLKYSSQRKALKAIRDHAGNNSIEFTAYHYTEIRKNEVPNGHPFMTCRGVINESENRCLTGEIDLVSGVSETGEYPCMIF